MFSKSVEVNCRGLSLQKSLRVAQVDMCLNDTKWQWKVKHLVVDLKRRKTKTQKRTNWKDILYNKWKSVRLNIIFLYHLCYHYLKAVRFFSFSFAEQLTWLIAQFRNQYCYFSSLYIYFCLKYERIIIRIFLFSFFEHRWVVNMSCFCQSQSSSHCELGYGKLCKETSDNNRSFSLIHYTISVWWFVSLSV